MALDKLVRVGIKAILRDPARRRELAVRFIMACQEMEGRDADRAGAERAYDAIVAERGEPGCRPGCDLVDEHDECVAHNGANLGPRFITAPSDAEPLPDIDLDEPDHADDERRHEQGK